MVRNEVTRTLMTVRIESNEQIEQAAHEIEERAEHIHNVTYTAPDESGEAQSVTDANTVIPAVGRNDPCPCGSGKKYKHCHGRLA